MTKNTDLQIKKGKRQINVEPIAYFPNAVHCEEDKERGYQVKEWRVGVVALVVAVKSIGFLKESERAGFTHPRLHQPVEK